LDKIFDLKQAYFGTTEEGQTITLYSLRAGDLVVKIMNYGGTIVAIEIPDKDNKVQNIVAGFSSFNEYQMPHPYVGSLIGRYANRIAYGKFQLDGEIYQLPINDYPNHLHGGDNGFHRKIWKTESTKVDTDQCSLAFSYFSPDGEEGYPGDLHVVVTFTVTRSNELKISYQANTDKSTPINLTSHSYFNLSGFSERTIYDHELEINGKFFTEKNADNVPTGKLLLCEGTSLDFRQRRKIGTHIKELDFDRGYNHNFVIDNSEDSVISAATLIDKSSGRKLEVLSDRPGLQVYTANWWDESLTGAHSIPYGKHSAVALETQGYPDSPNHGNFPNTILRPGERFHSDTIYRFSILK
jgi:aldose 1-epimerase